jgi:cysteine synthase A|tara:strand:+ start:1532 stop:2482 length:951 start_codon:yes stop_codon:yes gene_type:complete
LLFKDKRIFNSIDQTIGNTPMVRLKNLKKKFNLQGEIIAKLEFFNPLGSVKDRIGLAMIEAAEKKKKINNQTTIIEPTSGNTGIALAFVCATRGYRLILTMPSSMSMERRKMLLFLGAKIVITPKEMGMNGAIEKAKKIHKDTPNSIILDQFENQANPEIHYKTTAQEIWSSVDGQIDSFFSGVGTGGTITGVGTFLKEKKKDIKVIAVEPEDSAVLSGREAGSHSIQGIGAGFIPKNLNMGIIDEILSISNSSAFNFSRQLAKCEGIAGGISTGAVIAAAIEVHEHVSMKDKVSVIVIPSFAERYLSTELFSDLQ